MVNATEVAVGPSAVKANEGETKREKVAKVEVMREEKRPIVM